MWMVIIFYFLFISAKNYYRIVLTLFFARHQINESNSSSRLIFFSRSTQIKKNYYFNSSFYYFFGSSRSQVRHINTLWQVEKNQTKPQPSSLYSGLSLSLDLRYLATNPTQPKSAKNNHDVPLRGLRTSAAPS